MEEIVIRRSTPVETSVNNSDRFVIICTSSCLRYYVEIIPCYNDRRINDPFVIYVTRELIWLVKC
jgi:hypothetical protein